ncbi:MAG: YiiX/YebB-like N1pC/P60 family cysteine hydrolase [Verrucomicrobiota bacterium]|jgi:cell wall-associated NlpC family hydrolase
MADTFTQQQIDELPVLDYGAVRHNLESGDLVFCAGRYLFSGLIQKVTKSVWSHCGVIYKDPTLNRIFVLESEVMIGVRIVPLSKYLKDYHGRRRPYRGRIVIGRLHPAVADEKVKRAISFGMDELTKPYDNWEILRILVRILFGKGRRTRDRKYICSELVQECYRHAGIVFPYVRRSISPDDIWKDERVLSVCRIL